MGRGLFPNFFPTLLVEETTGVDSRRDRTSETLLLVDAASSFSDSGRPNTMRFLDLSISEVSGEVAFLRAASNRLGATAAAQFCDNTVE